MGVFALKAAEAEMLPPLFCASYHTDYRELFPLNYGKKQLLTAARFILFFLRVSRNGNVNKDRKKK